VLFNAKLPRRLRLLTESYDTLTIGEISRIRAVLKAQEKQVVIRDCSALKAILAHFDELSASPATAPRSQKDVRRGRGCKDGIEQ